MSSAPVGLLSAYRFPDVVVGGELVYLYDIEVSADYRRKGLGTALIRTLIDCCRSDHVRLIWAGTDITNTAARRLVLIVDDVNETYAKLAEKGVTVTKQPAQAPWNPGEVFAQFRDSEDNGIVISSTV